MKTLLQCGLIILFLFINFTFPAYSDGTHPAGIQTDGTLSSAGKFDLPGPDYKIRAEFGKQSGANLFHSFSRFNIHSGESATFTGPDSVQNIITRVTGGNASWIDGTICSAINGADMYLLNPAGIMFGPGASLDLTGSFHATTADYLRMGENERFYADPLKSSMLSVSPPAAFGFLSPDDGKKEGIGQISLEGKGYISPENWEDEFLKGLVVPEDETLSLIGGDIDITKGSYTVIDEEIQPMGTLIIPEKGKIQMAALGSGGELVPTEAGLDTSSFEKLGTVRISDQSAIHAGGGKIFIRGSQFFMDSSYLSAGQVQISETVFLGGESGLIDIQTDTVSLTNESVIAADTYDKGKSGDVKIRASESVYFSESDIVSGTYSTETNAGDAGSIDIQAKNLSFEKDSGIDSGSFGIGKGGDVTLRASESVIFSDSGIDTASRGQGESAGDAGDILIEGKSLFFTDGSWIRNESWGQGEGGDVTLRGSDTVSFWGTNVDGWASKIYSFTYGEKDDSGDAGDIFIETARLSFKDGGGIYAATRGGGKGGSVTVKASDSVEFTGRNPYGENTSGLGSGIYAPSAGTGEYAGKGGDIVIEARSVSLTDGGIITNSTAGSGDGGDIFVGAEDFIRISDSGLAVSDRSEDSFEPTGIYSGSYSTETYAGNAGRIHLKTSELTLSDQGKISASAAGQGNAGLIGLEADRLILTNGASISSVSSGFQEEGGNSGAIFISKQVKSADTISEVQPSDEVSLTDSAYITTSSKGAGNAGVIVLSTSRLNMDRDAHISSTSQSESRSGDAGAVFIGRIEKTDEDESLRIQGCDEIHMQENSRISTSSHGGGDAGVINIWSSRLELESDSSVSSASKGDGEGGLIGIHSDEYVHMQGGSHISTSSEGSGDAGGIGLEVSRLELESGAFISSASTAPEESGDSGGILIGKEIVVKDDEHQYGFSEFFENIFGGKEFILGENAEFSTNRPADTVRLKDNAFISTSSAGSGSAGIIELHGSEIELDSDAWVSSSSTSENQAGEAGRIRIRAEDEMRLSGSSTVTTEAANAGGGEITIQYGNLFYLSDSRITTSVQYGAGNGGNISIHSEESEHKDSPPFALLNRSEIKANAYEGKGGNIRIAAGQFVQSSGSRVEASSEKGIDGSVNIESPESDIGRGLSVLPVNFLDAASWSKTPCAERLGEHISRFIINGRDAMPTVPDDLRPSPPIKFLNPK
jgi:filamentous hemagglutinin family protein